MSSAVASVTPIDRPRLAIKRTKAKPQTTWSGLRGDGFTAIPNAVIRSTLGLSPYEKLVLMYLLTYINWKQSTAIRRTIRPVYVKNMAEGLNIGEKTVRRALKVLEETKLAIGDRARIGQACVYTLDLDAIAHRSESPVKTPHRSQSPVTPVRESGVHRSQSPVRDPYTGHSDRTQKEQNQETFKERSNNAAADRTASPSVLSKISTFSENCQDVGNVVALSETNEHGAAHEIEIMSPVVVGKKVVAYESNVVPVGQINEQPAVYVGGEWRLMNRLDGMCECGHKVRAGAGVLIGKAPSHYHDLIERQAEPEQVSRYSDT